MNREREVEKFRVQGRKVRQLLHTYGVEVGSRGKVRGGFIAGFGELMGARGGVVVA